MFRVIFLMNLDYRKGEINFKDLNSAVYDPTTAFNQSQLANMLSMQNLAKEWAKNQITVNAVIVEIVYNCSICLSVIMPGLPRRVRH